MPHVLRLANKYSIFDKPIGIKKHLGKITFLGGIPVLFGFYVSILIVVPIFYEIPAYTYPLLVSLLVIFVYGLGDDLLNYKPWKKLVVQLLISSIIVYKCNIHFCMSDIFPGLKQLEPFCSGIEVIIIASIINAYNLIDGSDGLTALLSLIGALTYGFLFYLDGQYFESAMAIAMAGALIGFIFYNLPPACVFMGDACSTFLGLAFGYFTFRYLNSGSFSSVLSVSNRSVIAFSIVSVPVLDLIRLFAHRLIKGKNPFKGDVNHIHHLLLQSGFSKMQVVVILSSVQLFFIFAAYMLMKSPISIFILFSIIWYIGLIIFVNKYFTSKRKREKQFNLNS
jgi:UDP-GlcNAc:undecaprenyl-phosphate/decaprenyl-phosphate GlcNAc-1-phosphate transferase